MCEIQQVPDARSTRREVANAFSRDVRIIGTDWQGQTVRQTRILHGHGDVGSGDRRRMTGAESENEIISNELSRCICSL